jgi:hypothetical protein
MTLKLSAAPWAMAVVREKTFQEIFDCVEKAHQRGCDNGGSHFAAAFACECDTAFFVSMMDTKSSKR